MEIKHDINRFRPTRRTGWDYSARPTTTTAGPRPELSFVRVRVAPARPRFAIGSTVTIPCLVNSYVKPTVEWSKNGQRLRPDRRVQVKKTKYAFQRYENDYTFE